jgi:hypothetical protein
MLARKGYGSALAYRVVREALEQDGQNPDAVGLADEESFGPEPGTDGSFGSELDS